MTSSPLKSLILVGLRPVASLKNLGRSSIIEENTEQCVFKFLRFRVTTFIENVSEMSLSLYALCSHVAEA